MSSSTTKVCFNFLCKQASDKWRRGWRRLTGEYADLCDRCASAYEDGKFCETFHLNAAGWRCCESCGNQIHCGCIVSFHMFVLLDAGGIECLACAEKSYILTPNPAWPPPSHCLPSIPERMKDLSSKTWNPIAGSGPVPWHQAPSLFSSFHIQSNVQRMPLEINVPGGTNMYRICDKLVTASPETKQENICERLVNGKLRTGPFEASLDDSIEISLKEQPYYCHGNDVKPVFPRMGLSSTWNMAISSSKNEANVVRFTSILSEPSAVSTPMYKQICNYSPVGLRCESQIFNGQARGGSQCQYQLNPRHHPQITDAELRQILRQSKSVAIPLFEKMLSASDAGRIGRLILPKRCAEAFFPYISQPEGMPLKVQDMNGKEWVFQFRFWLNCHSRMYVLEGITPCIQSMQLKAGDVVTFGWMEPEGKLVMGGRKASVIQSSDQLSSQVDETIVGVDASTPCDDSGGSKLANAISVSGHMGEKVEDKFIIPSKRKNPSFYAKRKRRKIENLNLIELKLNYKEVQGLMRPPRNVVPTIVVVEGCEFEEFGEEDGPVIGRPTILGVDHKGVKTQWVQCEICFKWRRVPADALLPSRWICSENAWDPNRSQCSAAEELTNELLQHMFSTQKKDSSRSDEIARHATNRLASEQGLHALANLAIKGETEHFPASSGDTSKLHPRHKSGCLCIICGCLQRRFKTLLDKREREQLAEASSQNLVAIEGNIPNSFDEHSAGESSTPPLKGQIDLNIQPGREEELSPGTGSGGPVKCPLSESNGRFIYLH